MQSEVLLSIAKEIANRVTEIIQKSSDLGVYTGSVGAGGDRTKYGDHLVENGLRAIIPLVFAKHNLETGILISEEAGQWRVGDAGKPKGIFMIVDPIDGSRNMRPHATRKPYLGFSIALGSEADLVANGTFNAVRVGLIRNIFHNEEYTAIRGQGAFLNGDSLDSSPITELSDTILGVSLDAQGDRLKSFFDQGVFDLLLKTKNQRRLGCSTLDLGRVASGDYDAHVSVGGGVKVHDVAAAKLIVEEAGGKVQLFRNGEPANEGRWLEELYNSNGEGIQSINFKMVAAGNEILLSKVISLLNLSP